jgi:large conductance mechanosensitive channel
MSGFRKFLLRGNVVDLAVGIVIGAAFGAMVTAFVAGFITPLVGLAAGSTGDFSKKGFTVSHVTFPYGGFITALVSFVLIAAAVYFFVVVPVNRLMDRFKPAPDEPTPTKDCSECLSSIPAAARKCAFCASVQAA